jgi:large subunit ribosomal protein L17
MLKSLVEKGSIETTVVKAKVLKRHADKLITLAKKQTLAAKRLAHAKMRVRYNPLTSKQKKEVKNNNFTSYNADRKVINKLFVELVDRFKDRNGGYTRLFKLEKRRGDSAQQCILQFLPAKDEVAHIVPEHKEKKSATKPISKKAPVQNEAPLTKDIEQVTEELSKTKQKTPKQAKAKTQKPSVEKKKATEKKENKKQS